MSDYNGLEIEMLKTIMVPLDGSTFAEHALPVAMAIARESGGQIHLVQVHEITLTSGSPELLMPVDASWDSALREQEYEYLESIANRVSERAGVAVRTELLDGLPASVLAAYAREADIDLVVMTTHGRGGLSRMWMGSVADGVVRHCGVPVLLNRPAEEKVDWATSPRFNHVLVPLDGSPLSRGVLDIATRLAALSDARLSLLRVIQPLPMLNESWANPGGEIVSQLVAGETARAHADLEEVATGLRENGRQVDVVVTELHAPAAAILEYAAANAVDLIAIATHGRGGISRLAVGSVADKIVRAAEVPVLVFRAPEVEDGRMEARNGSNSEATIGRQGRPRGRATASGSREGNGVSGDG